MIRRRKKEEKNMTYQNCKKLIMAGRYEKEDMMVKLDVFLLNNRISQEEYKELTAFMTENKK